MRFASLLKLKAVQKGKLHFKTEPWHIFKVLAVRSHCWTKIVGSYPRPRWCVSKWFTGKNCAPPPHKLLTQFQLNANLSFRCQENSAIPPNSKWHFIKLVPQEEGLTWNSKRQRERTPDTQRKVWIRWRGCSELEPRDLFPPRILGPEKKSQKKH